MKRALVLFATVAAAACDGSSLVPDGPVGVDAPPGAVDAPSADAAVLDAEVVTPCPLQLTGHLDSLAGAAVGVGPETFLVANGNGRMHLHLVARRGDTLLAIDSLPLTAFLFDPTTVIAQALDEGLVALGVSGERELRVIAIRPGTDDSPPQLLDHRPAELPGQLVSLSGRGDHLWTCTRDFFDGFRISRLDVVDPDFPTVTGSLRLPEDCGSIALSDDGGRVFMNTRGGVRSLDVTPLDRGEDPVLSEVFAPSAGVSVGAGHLLLRAPEAVRVLRQSDLVEVASIPARAALAASLVGDRLLVEGFRTVGSRMEGYVALWDVLGAAAPALRDEVILWAPPFVGDPPGSHRNAVTTDGSMMITRIGSRLFDLGGGTLAEVRVPALTPFDQLVAEGPAVRALGHSASAVLEVSDPHAVTFGGGGAFGVPFSFELTLDETGPGARLLFGLRLNDPGQVTAGRPWEPDPLPIRRWRLDGDGLPQPAGSFAIPGRGAAQLIVAGDAIYRLRLPAAGVAASLQAFALAAAGSGGEVLPPRFDLTPAPAPAASFASFDVDPVARLAVVATGTPDAAALLWIDLAATPPAVVERVELPGVPRHLRVAGRRAAATGGLSVAFFERGRGLVSEVSSGEAFIDHLLAFDGRVAIVAQSLPFGIVALGFGQGGVAPAAIGLEGVAQSLVATDQGLVVGLPAELLLFQTTCE